MGCINSKDEDTKITKKSLQDIQHTPKNGVIIEQELTLPVKIQAPEQPVETPTRNNNEAGYSALNSADVDNEFRRQHFDRSSMLRHSKKRKKSSTSNPSTPATSNAPTPVKTHPSSSSSSSSDSSRSQTPVKGNQDPADVKPLDVTGLELRDSEVCHQEKAWQELTPEATKEMQPDEAPSDSQEPLSASAKVAALLAASVAPMPFIAPPAPMPVSAPSDLPLATSTPASSDPPSEPPLAPPVPEIPKSPAPTPTSDETDAPFTPAIDLTAALDAMAADVDLTDVSPLPTPPPSPPPIDISSMPEEDDQITPKKISNGASSNLVTSTPISRIPVPTGATPASANKSKIPKLASGSSIGGHAKLAKTSSGSSATGIKTPSTKYSTGARQTPSNSGNLPRLRTRRQVAQELEEQQRSNFENTGDDMEDCGRLI